MENRTHIIGKCVSIFVLSVIIWHLYRFIITFSPFKSYLTWGTPQGYLFYLSFYIICLAILMFFVYYIDRSSLKKIGVSKVEKWKTHIIIGVSFAFFARFLEIGLGVLVGGEIVVFSYSSFFVIMFFIVTTFFVGLSEEGIFRGYIQGKLTDIWKFLPALLFTSVLFRIYHKNLFTVSMTDIVFASIPLPSFGMFAGYLYYRSRGLLLGAIALHMFYDLFGTIVPLGVDVVGVHPVLVRVSRNLMWLALIIVLKILADKTEIFRVLK